MTLQHEWIKTQVRIPQDLHPQIKSYAKDNDLSMNTAILDLIKKGLLPLTNNPNTSAVEGNEEINHNIAPERYEALQQQVIDLSAQLLEMMKVYGELNKKISHLPDISPKQLNEFLEHQKNNPT